MALSAVSSAVTTIGELIAKEAISLWGVRDKVKRLQNELKWMQCFLKDADSRQEENERIRLWVSEIRELAYDAEDVVEVFALKIESRRKGGFPTTVKRWGCILNEAWELGKTRSKIDEIMTRITDLTRQLQTYGVRELREGEESCRTRRELRQSFPHIIEDYIVGLKDETKKLVSVLTNDQTPNHKLVSICGMGGLGKTTLAKKVYQDRHVRAHFDHFAWVYVSQQFQTRKLWEDILADLTSSSERVSHSQLSDTNLAAKLFNLLKEKRCLVVVDDIWSIEAWESFKPAFPMADDARSKILLTSRNKEVASYADGTGYLLELECLKKQDSWELFRKTAISNTNSSGYKADARMEKLGKDMVEHCAGLPLAIVVLGGILTTKCSFMEWQMVLENVKSYLNRGKGLRTEDVLALSYDDLPSHLRPCFLYLSHFPEDYKIHVDRLIQLWVAEGIVSSKQGGETAEDVAEGYLIELAERYTIQVRERDEATLKMETFQMHDLMRDLCLSRAEQENFVFIVDQSDARSLSTIIRKVRRVSVQKCFRIQHIQSPNLRSLLFFNAFLPRSRLYTRFERKILEELNRQGRMPRIDIGNNTGELEGVLRYIFNNFKLLRVLNYGEEIYTGGAQKLPSEISNLIHLRLLSLRSFLDLFPKLPSSLGNLRCLQTLDLGVDHSVHVPDVIWRMEELRHLYLPVGCKGKTKLKLGTLRNLQTLVNFNTQSCYLKDLAHMEKLRVLEINGAFKIEDFNREELSKNQLIIRSRHLQSLSIISDEEIDPMHLDHLLLSCVSSICKLSLNAAISKLPRYPSPSLNPGISMLPRYPSQIFNPLPRYLSPNLAYIQLTRCRLEEDPMLTLRRLPNLRVLEVKTNGFIGERMVCYATGFPQLHSLRLWDLDYLKELEVFDGAMPCLRRLEIKRCRNLKMQLPDRLWTLFPRSFL